MAGATARKSARALQNSSAGKSWASGEALASERLIFFDRTSSYYDLTNAMFREAGVNPRGAIEPRLGKPSERVHSPRA